MKKYKATLFWEGHGHNDRDHYHELESDDLETLKKDIARKTLSGDGYQLINIITRDILWKESLDDEQHNMIKEDIEKIKQELREEQARIKREKKVEEDRIIALRKEQRELNQYKLYLQLEEKFEDMDNETLQLLKQKIKG